MIRKAFSYFSFSLVGSIIGIISLLYLTRLLSLEEFGFIGLMQVILFLIVPIFSFRADSLIGIYKVQKERREYILFRNMYITFSLFVILFIVSFLLSIVYLFYNLYFTLFLLTLLICIARYFIQLHNQELIQDGDSILYGKLSLTNQIATLFTTVVILSFFDISWEGRLLAILIVDVIFAFFRIKYSSSIYKEFSIIYNKKIIMDIVLFGSPLFVALGASWVTMQSDKVIVGYFFSMEALGLYTVAYSIGALLNGINQAVRNSYVPTLRKSLKENKGKKLMNKFQLYYGSFILIVALIISIIFFYFDSLILGAEYAGVWKIIALVSFAYAIFGIYSSYGAIFEYYKLTVLKTKFVVYGAIINLVLSFGLLSTLGYLAPAVGTVASFFIIMIVSYIFAIKELEKRGVGN